MDEDAYYRFVAIQERYPEANSDDILRYVTSYERCLDALFFHFEGEG